MLCFLSFQVFFLQEQHRAVAFHQGATAIQATPTDVLISFDGGASDKPTKISTSTSVEQIAMTDGALAVYGNGKVICYEMQRDLKHLMNLGEFQLFCDGIAVYEQSVCTLEGNRVNVRSLQGTIKQTMTLTEEEGAGETIAVQGKFLVVCSKFLFVKIWDLSKRDLRLHIHPVNLREKIPSLSNGYKDVKLSAEGTHLSVCCAGARHSTDAKIHVIDFESNGTYYFNFNSGKSERDDVSVPPNSAQSTEGSINDDYEGASAGGGGASRGISARRDAIVGSYVIHHAWDEVENNFLVCQTRKLIESLAAEEPDVFVSMFFHDEIGLIVHDTHRTGGDNKAAADKLVGVSLPKIALFEDKSDDDDKTGGYAANLLMKDFEGRARLQK